MSLGSELSKQLRAWRDRVRMLEENARNETDEQAARHYAARAAELGTCVAQLETIRQMDFDRAEAEYMDRDDI